ncbi:MAG: hypothetical protein VKN13_06435 [Cyanobacteriota bacterium]|nr:hypothetical protein [Cyanobacteriota bacterium]
MSSPVLISRLKAPVLLGLAGVAMAAAAPAQALTTINTVGVDKTFGDIAPAVATSNSFTADGITATFFNPNRNGANAVSRTVDAATITLPGGGTCLGGSRPAGSVLVCGNPVGTPIPQINSIQISFDKDVRIKSISGYARSNILDGDPQVNSVTSTWTNGLGASQVFTYSVDTASAAVSIGNFRETPFTSTFGSFVAKAGTPVTVASAFPLVPGTSTTSAIDYWVGSIDVEQVPGPLPILGAAASFGWSRRLRRRINRSANV